MERRAVPFHEYMDIKKFICEINEEGKLFAKLPKDKWELPESELKMLMKKLSVIKPSDIEVEKMYYNKEYDTTVFEVCIHDFLRFGFLKRKNGDIEYNQLTWRGY
ncbi:MAG: hypothetical protein SO034_10260 [Staphylococcus hyicus]|uniref:DUF2087 domain-containing protein n=1 Tax=Staphylococcus agnetis TaxID=985762 RepID=A0ABX3Z242_9STAP|nr:MULTISPECIES: hypothetical protein [Staphylococcus]MDG4943900.1 hypothetical protein [Staphylococcus agnetis]MDY3698789.1 hypothetical protein [Staphylococcus hyicus]OSP22557.1 hypothetical protein B9L42_00310 [Staphylococcus agnetis]OSP23152.1 hypothetical protein B9M87_09485 [Staphylococcus agnetis]OTW30549.1 hypothetical protein B9M88_09795 [Staphylococcus agnetis]